MTSIAIVTVLTSISLSGLSGVKKRADTIYCQNNLRHLGLAAHIYATDNGDRLPYPNSSYGGANQNPQYNWFNALDTALYGLAAAANKQSERLTFIKQDPLIKKLGASWFSNAHTIKMNEWLSYDYSGMSVSDYFWSLNDFVNSSKTVLFFDGKAENNKIAGGEPGSLAKQTQGTEGDVMRRHMGKANVVFVDGHSESRDEKHQSSGDCMGWKVNETSLIWKPWMTTNQ